ncbi:hypothetical protein ACC721_37480, partial [Rhizobium ruizarguesonis]
EERRRREKKRGEEEEEEGKEKGGGKEKERAREMRTHCSSRAGMSVPNDGSEPLFEDLHKVVMGVPRRW